jgi:NADH:ubiquinone oxidoreductase subunit 5 (subunit L)/multisubunit Na+/H+ antiporter MnhA subunit
MRRFSGLRTVLPTTHWTFLCGALALAGFPLLSGFWSKDEILAASYAARDAPFGEIYLLLFVVAILTAGITAFYTARAYFMTFWGEVKIPPEAHGHAHESPPVMTYPLLVLAAGAVFVGLLLGPTHLFEGLLEHHWMHTAFPRDMLPHEAASHGSFAVMGMSIAVVFIGIGLAYLMYVRQPGLADQLARKMVTVYELSRNKFYLDELYEALIVGPLTAMAHVARIFDQYILDGLVDLIGQLPSFVGYLLRPAQNGLVQFYALLMALGVAGFVVAVLLRLQ